MKVGGAYTLFNLEPDIVVYAKAMSNGYPMAAVVGRENIMDKAEESFISSTYWTEKIGPNAALATIKKMKRENVPSHLIKIGEQITNGWKEIANECGLKIKISGIPPLTKFSFCYENSQELITLFTQEMLERGFLAKDSVYVSYSHKETDVEIYMSAVKEVFKKIKKGIDTNKISKMLKGPVAHTGFKRLT